MLCFGITPETTSGCRRTPATSRPAPSTLTSNGIASALAHPFYAVAAPLTRRHRRRLAELFPVWESRNGSRAAELNMPAVDLRRDAGRDRRSAARTTTPASTSAAPSPRRRPPRRRPSFSSTCARRRRRPAASRASPRSGRTRRWRWRCARSAATASAAKVEARPGRVLEIAERLLARGRPPRGQGRRRPRPRGRARPAAGLAAAVGIEARGGELVAYMQDEGFTHAGLYRRARRIHERRLRGAVGSGLEALAARRRSAAAPAALFAALRAGDPLRALGGVHRPPSRQSSRAATASAPRVAIVADGIGAMHGVTRTIEEIRERGIPGFEIEVVGTDPDVDRRLPRRRRARDPLLRGDAARRARPARPRRDAGRGPLRPHPRLRAGPGRRRRGAAQPDRRRRRCSAATTPSWPPTPACAAATAASRRWRGSALGAFYAAPSLVLSPSPAADALAAGSGSSAARIGRWERGVDVARFDPAKADPGAFPASSRSSTPAASPARRASTCSPRASCAPSASTRACTCCSPAAAPRRRSCARGSASTRPSSAGSRARSWPAPTPAPTVPLLLAHRHLRPGRARGRGQRLAGRRRRRGRPGGAGRGPPHRPALPARPRPARRRAPAARRLAGAAPPARRRRDRRRPRATAGRRRWSSSPPATGAASGRRGRWRRPAPAPPEPAGGPAVPQYDGRSTIPLSISTASSPGSTSTSGCWSSPRTPRCRCWSGSASARSTPPTWTSSSWSGWRGCSTSSTLGSTPAAPTASRPGEQIDAIQARVLELDAPPAQRLQRRPAARRWRSRGSGSSRSRPPARTERREIDARFHEQVFPALTPLVVGLGRPFPYISNLSLSLGVLLRDPDSGAEIIARVKVPKELLGRFLPVGAGRRAPSSRWRRRSPPTSTRSSPGPR